MSVQKKINNLLGLSLAKCRNLFADMGEKKFVLSKC